MLVITTQIGKSGNESREQAEKSKLYTKEVIPTVKFIFYSNNIESKIS